MPSLSPVLRFMSAQARGGLGCPWLWASHAAHRGSALGCPMALRDRFLVEQTMGSFGFLSGLYNRPPWPED